MSLLDSQNVRIIEVDENNQRLDDIERVNTNLNTNTSKLPAKKGKKLKYAWLFFFASIMIWSSIKSVFHIHGMHGLGTAIGFLFFVPNIYNKVMEKIDNL